MGITYCYFNKSRTLSLTACTGTGRTAIAVRPDVLNAKYHVITNATYSLQSTLLTFTSSLEIARLRSFISSVILPSLSYKPCTVSVKIQESGSTWKKCCWNILFEKPFKLGTYHTISSYIQHCMLKHMCFNFIP